MKRTVYILMLALLTQLVVCCQNETIPYYNSDNNSVRFSYNSLDGYSNGVLYLNYSFVSNPLDEYVTYDIPIVLIGNKNEKDRSVNYTVDTENSTAPEGSYELMEGVIPADSIKGHIRVKLHNVTEDNTYELRLVIQPSADLKTGPINYLRAALSWNNTIPAPPNNYTRRTYNMMIQGTTSFSSTSLSYYSPNALKVIIAALGWDNWDDPKAHPEYQPAYERFFIQANYKYLPHFTLLIIDQSYPSFAALLGTYIEEYNKSHDTPLLHDAGELAGSPIQARKY